MASKSYHDNNDNDNNNNYDHDHPPIFPMIDYDHICHQNYRKCLLPMIIISIPPIPHFYQPELSTLPFSRDQRCRPGFPPLPLRSIREWEKESPKTK